MEICFQIESIKYCQGTLNASIPIAFLRLVYQKNTAPLVEVVSLLTEKTVGVIEEALRG